MTSRRRDSRWYRTYRKPQPLKDLLRPYRGEGVLAAALLVGVPLAVQMLAAIALVGLPRWKRPASRMPNDHRARWLWLWSGYAGGAYAPSFLHRIARHANVPIVHALRVWPALMISRAVMPAGRGVVNRPALRRLERANALLAEQQLAARIAAEPHGHDEYGDDVEDDDLFAT